MEQGAGRKGGNDHGIKGSRDQWKNKVKARQAWEENMRTSERAGRGVYQVNSGQLRMGILVNCEYTTVLSFLYICIKLI